MSRLRRFVTNSILALVIAISPALAIPAYAAVPGINEAIDISALGGSPDNASKDAAISHDGRYVAFASRSNNLVSPSTTGTHFQVFVRDRLNATTTLVSVSPTGSEGNSQSDGPRISADGRYVVFSSYASNLVSGDTNGTSDVFIRDLQENTTQLVSANSSGVQANGFSGSADISGDGQHVVFSSSATNLVPGAISSQIYRKHLPSGEVEMISQSYSGEPSNRGGGLPRISCDGQSIVFITTSNNLVEGDTIDNPNSDKLRLYLVDTYDGMDLRYVTSEHSTHGSISCDGSAIAFFSQSPNIVPDDNNGVADTFIYDRVGNSFERISVDSDGNEANGISASGRAPGISGDGRYVAFNSHASNLVPNDTNGSIDVFLRDRLANTTEVLSINSSGAIGNGHSRSPTISADGKHVAYDSFATNLVDGFSGSNGLPATYVSLTTSPDSTAPVLGEPTWSANPINVDSDTSFSVPVTDDLSGVETGEYFIGTDPGVGSATPLTWDGTNLNSDDFGATLQPGVYDIGIRAKDVADNWSATLTTYLVVFDPNGPSQVIGQQLVKPGTGDTLPWISTDNKDFASFGFNVQFTSTGTVDPSSEFSFNYTEKGNCSSPNTPVCNSFVLTTTSFSWFALSGTNNSAGTFQGLATLSIDGGAPTNVLFRVEAVDGNQLTPSESDSFVLKVWPEGSNPQTDSPLYQVSADFTPSSGNANGGVQVKQ